MLRGRAKRAVDLAKRRSPLRRASVTQLPYLVPGAPVAIDLRRRLRRQPLGSEELATRVPVSDGEEHRPCPLCGAERVVLVHHPARYDGAGELLWSYRVGECPECGLVYRVPALTHQRVTELYEDGDYADYLEGDYAKNRRRRYQATLDAFAPQLDCGGGRTLLDFGCGTGLFMKVADRRGFVPYGIDLAPTAVTMARNRFGPDRAFLGTAHDIAAQTDQRFDVITMWSVLAHIPDPREQLGALRRVLRPGGMLLILTVNADSLQRHAFGGHWNGYTPGHLMFWSRATVTELLLGVGFEQVELREFYGEGIETQQSALTPRQVSRYRRLVDRTHGGNMLRVLAHAPG